MNFPGLLLRPDLGKRVYRLHCRFRVWPEPPAWLLESEKVKQAERFVVDMHKQGYEYVERFGFKLTGPFVPIVPQTIRAVRMPPARVTMPRAAQGETFRATGQESVAQTVPDIEVSEYWEYDISAVFVHRTILTEVPDLHEEQRP